MAADTLELQWEWPAGRAIASAVLVKVESVRPAAKGLFGILGSPSIANALPEATEVRAVVDGQDARFAGREITLRLPGVEARKLAAGGWAAFGLLADAQVCACVQAAPVGDAEALRRWVAGWKCPD